MFFFVWIVTVEAVSKPLKRDPFKINRGLGKNTESIMDVPRCLIDFPRNPVSGRFHLQYIFKQHHTKIIITHLAINWRGQVAIEAKGMCMHTEEGIFVMAIDVKK